MRNVTKEFVGGLIHEHLWDRRTESLSVQRGRRSHEERIEAKHTSSLPRFGPHGCVKPYSYFVVCIEFLLGSAECYSTHQRLTRPSLSVLFFSPPPSTLHMGLLLYAQGVTDRWQQRQRVKMERCCGRYSYLLQCIIPNPDGRGQGH